MMNRWPWLHLVLLCSGLWAPGPRLDAADCNGNGKVDAQELAAPADLDRNENGIPDECETSPFRLVQGGDLELGSPMRAFVAADFTGDGRGDLLGVYSRVDGDGPAVSLLVQDENGDFDPRLFPENPGLPRLAAGDFDGDGDLDVVAVESSSLWALWNDGTGEFNVKAQLHSADGLGAFDVGDFNGDGRADLLAVFRPSNRLVIWHGQPGGSLVEQAAVAAGVAPAALALADFDGDGRLDVALGSLGSGGTSWIRNLGNGAAAKPEVLEASDDPREILVARDWNGDGRMDLAAMSRFSLAFVLAAGPGGPSAASSRSDTSRFETPVRFVLGRELLPIRCATALDAEQDGDLDLVLGISSLGPGGQAGLLFVLNRGDGVFRSTSRIELGAAPVWIEVVDLDRDGQSEILYAPAGKPVVSLLRVSTAAEANNAGSGAGLELESDRLHVGFEPHSCALADLDRDGDLDMAVIDGETNVNILTNGGDGNLKYARSYHVRNALEMISLLAIDLEADGDIDIALADEYTSNVLILHNDSAGNFNQVGSHAVGERPNHLCGGDITGDGIVDLACVDLGQNTVSILRGRAGGLIGEVSSLAVRSRPMAAALGDFRGQGKLDLAVASHGTSEVLILHNDGKGRFQPAAGLPARWPTYVVAQDFDADGKVDLAVTSYGSRQVLLFWNQGTSFEPGVPLSATDAPYTAIATDLDGDKLPDLITSNTYSDSISIYINSGQRAFAAPVTVDVGSDPRFSVAGDIDRDGDVDIVVANHSSLDLTLLRARSIRPPQPRSYLHRIVSEAEFFQLSMPVSSRKNRQLRQTKFVIPASLPGADSSVESERLPAVFQDVKLAPLHQDFLAATFPERFPALGAELYDALTGRRATRQYWSGVLYSLRSERGPVYGFTLLAAFADDPAELPTVEEVARARQTLAAACRLEPLVYYPDQGLARDSAKAWRDPGFPVLLEDSRLAPGGTTPGEGSAEAPGAFEVYTASVSYGRVRLLTAAAFQELNTRGSISFQDILILERAPRDIEGVVAGIVTAEQQGDLSHLALRTARRGTPNAYLEGALRAFAALDGRLARLEVDEHGVRLVEASPAEAASWWRTREVQVVRFPHPDTRHGGLDALDEMLRSGTGPPEARFGGKASNFARLWSILDDSFSRYRERGFGIPIHYYEEFVATAQVSSARDPGRDVTGREFLDEIAAWPAFASDSRLRFDVLAKFREDLELRGEVSPDLVHRVARRIREVFGRDDLNVRFRSSSNVEDALEFNGAGLYESTSACAADDLDGDDDGPSRCDPARLTERGIGRALKRVWASLWSFRAYEERAYFSIPQDQAFMAVLVSLAYQDERANGVAITGNPLALGDKRFLVTSQVGEESVVSPEPGVLAERSLVAVQDGAVQAITRAQASSQSPRGTPVLSDRELEELGLLLAHIDARFPLTLGGRQRRDVLLDVEFKVDSTGCVAVKQVRPFLRPDAEPAAPAVTLVVPDGAQACGVFVPSRAPRRAWELQSVVRFRPGRHSFLARSEAVELDLIEELTLGPSGERARPQQAGRILLESADSTLRLFFGQAFVLEDGRTLVLELRLELAGSGSSERVLVLDEAFLARELALQANLGQVITFASCGYDPLPLWEVRAEAEAGLQLRLLERHDPPPTLNDTGPAALVRAELAWRGNLRVVEGYTNLQYTALRHNRAPRYWIRLEPPLRFGPDGQVAPVLELVAPEPRLNIPAEARFLDETLSPIAALSISSWQRRAAPPSPRALFLRGDANGNGSLEVLDAVTILQAILYCELVLTRPEAADHDSSGEVTPLDVVSILAECVGLAVAP